MKRILTFALLVCTITFFGCKKELEINTTGYYKAVNNGSIVSYQKIDYSYVLDSMVESITIFNLDGELIQKQKNSFVKSANGLDVIINGERKPYLFLTNKNDCATYRHPMGYDIRNCFLETLDYKGNKEAIKYSYREEVTDGLSMEVYLANNYSLIDKKDIIGSGGFDELIKIDKSVIPKEIKDKM